LPLNLYHQGLYNNISSTGITEQIGWQACVIIYTDIDIGVGVQRVTDPDP